MSLLTVGTVAFDDIETPFGKADRVVGGAATYISLAASQFVNPVHVVSVIGDDFPEETLALMRTRGITLEGLQVREGEKSFFWAGRYHHDMNSRDTLTTELNVLADFDPVVPEAYRKTPYLMLGNLTPAVQKRVIEQMETRPRLIALDTMNFWMDSALDSLLEVIGMVDMLIINDEEARQLSGEYSLVKAAEHIQNLGPGTLIIKKGEHGALLFHQEHIFFAPALPLAQVFDPTGAGDTFAGGVMGYLAQSDELTFENLKRAVIFGSAMASFCVEDFGIQRLRTLSSQEVRDRVHRFAQLVHFEV
jgi:sugar/nucleoside kinase (ribokinase family)